MADAPANVRALLHRQVASAAPLPAPSAHSPIASPPTQRLRSSLRNAPERRRDGAVPVAIYARFSSTLQNERSVDDQVRRCREFVAQQGGNAEAAKVFADFAISGASLDRPGFEAMRSAVDKKAIKVIVTEDMSRMSRDFADSAHIFKRLQFLQVPLVGVADGIDTSQKHSKLSFTVKSLVADIYLDDLRDKTLRGLEGRALQGFATGKLDSGASLYVPGSGSLADNIVHSASKGSCDNVAGATGRIATRGEIKPNTVVILDKVVLQRIQHDLAFARSLADSHCVLLEPHGFSDGLNLFSAPSPERIAHRTAQILARAREIQHQAEVETTFETAVDTALGEGARAVLTGADPQLQAQLRVVRAAYHPDVSTAAISDQLNGAAGISEPELVSGLAQLNAEQQTYARELLARQAEVFSRAGSPLS